MKIINTLILVSIMGIPAMTLAVEKDSPNVDLINSRLSSSFKAGSIKDMVNLYSKDAVMLPPSSEILTSKKSIRTYWNDLKKVGVKDYTIYPISVTVEGNRAYASGMWVATRVSAEGETFNLSGDISNILEKQADGSWKITMQTWN